MKPNFALHFTDDSVSLLRRTKRGWTEVGQSAFDVADLSAALAALRAKAEALAPDGVTTKLVIPKSQLKYIELIAPGPDLANRRAQIEAGLDGQTPYDVSELVYDWSGKGPALQVVMVARETLDEAESFATQHGFNPVSFVAIPDAGTFRGEPWFGPSALAATLLSAGDSVERDQDPIRLPYPPEAEAQTPSLPLGETAAEPALDATPEPAPEAQPEPVPEPIPELIPEPIPVPAPEPRPELMPEPAPVADPLPLPDDLPAYDPLDEPTTAAIADEMASVSRTEVSLSEVTLPGGTDGPVDPARIAATLSAGDPPARADLANRPLTDMPLTDMPLVETPMSEASFHARLSDTDEAPMAVDVDDLPDANPPGNKARFSVLDSGLADDPDASDLPPIPSGAALAAFNRRGTGDLPPATRPVAAPAARPALAGAPAKPGVERPVAAKPAPKFGYETPGAKAPPRDSALRSGAAAGSKALRGLGALVTAPSIPGGKKVKIVTSANPSAGTPPATGAASATGQGTSQATGQVRRPVGLGSRPMPVRGKPRHLGLILTGILLVMLALAAALSSFYITRNDTADAAVDTATADLPAPEDEMLADLQDPADLAAVDPANADAADAATTDTAAVAADTATNGTPDAAVAAAPAPEPAPGAVIAEDVATTAQPATEPQDEIFLATADTAPAALDAAALPLPVARGDPLPAAQLPPPPFGTVYQFDENGLIRPTPEGITTPEGVLLTAGPPPRLPPARPDSIAAAAAAAAAAAPVETPAATALAEPAVIIPADPALANARPLPRPADLAPPPAATIADDDAALAPLADPRLAGIRPATRPESLLAAAIAAGAITAPDTDTGSTATDSSLALVAPEGTVTPIGLAISRRPAARPDDMNRAVEEAVAAAVRQPDPPLEEIAPEDEPEPEAVASAAPRIPSTANVAQQATVKNAINLREVNLIGVYGTSAERYALVRNPNGRYVKVEVGDRLDGGRVAAITASEVRYEKRGRMVVLALPNS